MAGDRSKHCELDQEKSDAHESVKIICLGDSAVGKSKYVRKSGKENQSQNGSGEIRKVLYVVSISRRGGALTGAQGVVGRHENHVSNCAQEEVGESQRGRNQGAF